MGRRRGRGRDEGQRGSEGGASSAATLQTPPAGPSLPAKWTTHNWGSVVRKRGGRGALQRLRAESEGVSVSVAGRRDRASAGRRPLWSSQELEE